MKSNNKKNGQALGFGRLSMVSLMALSLMAGHVVSAAELELWTVDGKTKYESLSDASKAIDWLNSKKDYTAFVKEFRNEPLKFAEGIHKAWEKAAEGGAKKVDEFKKSVRAGFEKLADKEWDSEGRLEHGKLVKTAYLAFVDAMFAKGNTAKTEDLLVESFKKLPEAARVAMNASDKKGEVTSPVGELSIAQLETLLAACEAPKPDLGKEQEFLKQIEALKNEIAGLKKERDEKQGADDLVVDQLNRLNSELLAQKEQAAQVDPALLANQNRQRDDFADIVGRLLGNQEEEDDNGALAALGQNDGLNQLPFTNQNPRNNQDNTDLLANAPLPVPDQTGGGSPIFNTATTGLAVPITYDMGVTTGKAELADADDISGQNEIRTKFQVGGSLDPMTAQAQLQSKMKRSQVAMKNAKDKLAEIDAKLDQVSQDPDSVIGAAAREELARRKSDVESKRTAFENQRSLVNTLQDGDPRKDAATNQMIQMQQDLANSEKSYNAYNGQFQTARNAIAAQAKTLKGTRDKLNSTITNLKGQIEEMSSEEQLASKQIAGLQNGMLAGTANAGRGTSIRGGASRRPTLLGGAMNPTGGRSVRGNLGGSIRR